MVLNKIIVSEKSVSSNDAYDIIQSNISVINLLRSEGISFDHIHLDSKTSYFIDYYLGEYNNGGFSQYVWNTNWNSELNKIIQQGLQKIGAKQHLDLFLLQSSKVDLLTAEELTSFLEGEYFGENPIREHLQNDSFYKLDEKILDLNAQWLKAHPDLLVLNLEEMYHELEKFIGRKIER